MVQSVGSSYTNGLANKSCIEYRFYLISLCKPIRSFHLKMQQKYFCVTYTRLLYFHNAHYHNQNRKRFFFTLFRFELFHTHIQIHESNPVNQFQTYNFMYKYIGSTKFKRYTSSRLFFFFCFVWVVVVKISSASAQHNTNTRERIKLINKSKRNK